MTIARRFLTALLAFLIAAPTVALAQRTYSQAELDQMLAPIALYPDPLLSQVLMAATYPLEVAEAARWSRANPGLQGDDAVRAVEYEDWDPSVKSLVAFPQILARMDENSGWTRSLGDAFLMQEPHVMETVQRLRQRAYAAGNLNSSEQYAVQQRGQSVLILPANPAYVYVPYYDPWLVYGVWWWPAYPPVVWAPWPGYVRPYRPGISVGFWWGQPVSLSLNFFFGDFDWNRRQVRIAHTNSYYYRAPVVVNRTVVVERGRWQHDPHHRRSVGYRQAARVQSQPAATVQAQPQTATPQRRSDRRENRQAAPAVVPAQAQPQPTVQPRTEQRDDRRAERQAAMQAQRQARQQAQESQRHAQQQQPQRQARQQALDAQRQVQQQARQQAQEAQRQSRQEQRARMPEAVAPQQPRAERREPQREHRGEPRN